MCVAHARQSVFVTYVRLTNGVLAYLLTAKRGGHRPEKKSCARPGSRSLSLGMIPVLERHIRVVCLSLGATALSKKTLKVKRGPCFAQW